MNRTAPLLLAAFATLAAGAFSIAAPPDAKVEQKLKELYPKAETEITGTSVVNGVRIDDVRVTANGDTVAAQLTSEGDVLYYGIPRQSKALDKMAAQTLQGLLKTVPADVDTYRTNYYKIDLQVGKQVWELSFNAVGQLLDVNKQPKPTEAAAGNVGAGTRKKLEALGVQYSDGGKVQQIAPYEDVEGYYLVDLLGKNGLGLHIIMNESGIVWETKFDLKRDTLPQPVAVALDQLFEGGSVTRVSRVEQQFYQFDQTAGDQVLKIRMHPNGDIFKISAGPGAAATPTRRKK